MSDKPNDIDESPVVEEELMLPSDFPFESHEDENEQTEEQYIYLNEINITPKEEDIQIPYWDEYSDDLDDEYLHLRPPISDNIDNYDTPHIESPVNSYTIREEEDNSDILLPLLHDDFHLPVLDYNEDSDETGELVYLDHYENSYDDMFPPTPGIITPITQNDNEIDDLNDLFLNIRISSNNNRDNDENENENELMDASELDKENFGDYSEN